MNRVFDVQCRYLELIEKYDHLVLQREKPTAWEIVHMSSCGRLGYIIAEKLGADPEIASIASSIHDIGRVISGKCKGHAEAGYIPSKDFLSATGLFKREEIEEISAAVRNHSKKDEKGSILEEIVKDADVIDSYQYKGVFSRIEHEKRYEDIIAKGLM